MRTFIIAIAAVTALTGAAPTADACSGRGRFCGYPAWAANAFEDATGRAYLSSTPHMVRAYGPVQARPHRRVLRRER